MKQKKLIVIGGGAAGFFCAVNAARLCPSLKVTILEKTGKLLSKVRISGGGRCNTTHACFEVAELAKRYPRGQNFVKKTFHAFQPADTIEWFRERGVALKKEADGRMFPVTDDSSAIVQCLLHEADRYGVEISMHTEVHAVKKTAACFDILLQNGKTVTADFICIACGGFPKLSQFAWLQELGHTIVPPVPSLFTFNMPGNPITQLMGVSVEQAQVKIEGTKLMETGPLLITHWGMSGPVILRLSAWGARELAEKEYRFTVLVNWLGGENEQELRNRWADVRKEMGNQHIGNKNPFGLPARLWQFILASLSIPADKRWSDLTVKEQNLLINTLTRHSFPVSGKTTFKEEFVTCGGIQLSEINPSTSESRKIDGLYFAGEIMDVDGITGGFNFQHAWTSGWLVASSVAERCNAMT
jgi:predicted Rossmann fold flavoprotein